MRLSVRSFQGPILSSLELRDVPHSKLAWKAETSTLCHRLIATRRGTARIETPGLTVSVRPQIGAWIPAGTEATVSGDHPLVIADFAASSCPTAWRRPARLILDDVIEATLGHLCRFPVRPWHVAVVSMLVEHLNEAQLTARFDLTIPSDSRARTIAESLIQDPSDRRELTDWARVVGASATNLRRLFRIETGLPFRAWRHELRMSAAKRHLAGGVPVGQTSSLVGYLSPEAFMRSFRRHVGQTPSEFASQPLPPPRTPSNWSVRQGELTPRTVELLQELFISYVKECDQGEDVQLNSTRSVAVLAAFAVLAAACGTSDSDDANDETTAPSTTAEDATTGSTAAPPTAVADEGAGYPRTVEHAWGATTLEQRPQVAMIDLARGLAGDLLAMEVESDLLVAGGWEPQDFQSAPQEYYDAAARLGIDVTQVPSYSSASTEEIVRLQPDVVVAYDYREDLDVVRSLEDSGIPVIGLPFEDRDEYYRVLIETFGLEATAPRAFEQASGTLAAANFPTELEVSIFSSYDVEGAAEVEVLNEGSPTGQLLGDIGITVKRQEPDEEGFAYIAEELLERLDSDVLVNLVTYGPASVIEESPVFQSIPAVQEGRFVSLSEEESYVLNFPSLLTAPLVASALQTIADTATP